MIIKKLEVVGLRAFEQAEFEFQSGMNLLVGVNGVGKATVLDALRICLSKILPEITVSRNKAVPILESDMRVGSDTLKISCDFQVEGKTFNLLINRYLENVLIKENESGRDEKILIPDIEKISPPISTYLASAKDSKVQTLGIHFSTRRSFASNREPSSTEGGQFAAFSESLLENRDFNLRDIAYWMRAQEVLAEESSKPSLHLAALHHAAKMFLPDCKNLHVVKTSKGIQLMIDKGGISLNVNQLSDGERGMLALALDLAKRLSQANPGLENPVKDGKAIVLIDELDLHLHPKWQRSIVEQLTTTFPNCQFIATTHSPQIIPSFETEQVLLLKDNEVIYANRTHGMDSNWILKFLMDADDRPQESIEAIQEVENLIKKGDFKAARIAISKHKKENLDLTEWSVFEARMAKMEIFNKAK